MTETPEPAAKAGPVTTAAPPPGRVVEKPPRLYRVAAWVVIIAGITFIAWTLFFAGAMVFGAGKCHHHRHHHHGQMGPGGGPGGPGPGWQFRFPGGPPPPGVGPGFPGGPPPGAGGPGTPTGPAQPPTSAPTVPSPPPGR
ncbi:hypothetical protein [Mycobacterium bourgelatii]|uniref:Proline rich protein n=1 Tax=Mycobacterium bourgelatii TaxID=1273442 RepID=A0A7I9YXM1_MYCBU|nr:hypothetical protein [Mycobacterium bourgelatii]MCV6972955.1 hypothetical protein [Mycobacterium bourgelatii]GFG93353.1 hypothetical protein MBOU_53950 [Mycobacterium bourgelatii]